VLADLSQAAPLLAGRGILGALALGEPLLHCHTTYEVALSPLSPLFHLKARPRLTLGIRLILTFLIRLSV
jgi:hypothetical protein